MDGAAIGDIIVQACRTGSDMRSQQTDVADDLSDTAPFSLCSGQQQNRARAKEQHQACTRQRTVENRFHGFVSKSKRKRESATDISKRRRNRGSTESHPTKVPRDESQGEAPRSRKRASNQSKHHRSSTESRPTESINRQDHPAAELD